MVSPLLNLTLPVKAAILATLDAHARWRWTPVDSPDTRHETTDHEAKDLQASRQS